MSLNALAGCEQNPCEPGHACTYTNYSLLCIPCQGSTVSMGGISCAPCAASQGPNENGLHAPVPTLDNLDFNRAWNSPSKSTEAFVTRPTGWVQPGTGICATGTDPDIVDGISCDGNLNAGGDTGSGGFSGTESLFQLGQSGFHDCE